MKTSKIGTVMIVSGVTTLLGAILLSWLIQISSVTIELLLIGSITFIVMMLFASLRIAVYSDRVEFALGPVVLRRTIAMTDIVDCDVEPVPPFSGYGWKIHGKTTLVTVGGKSALALQLRNGKGWWIASDQSEKLRDTIRDLAKL